MPSTPVVLNLDETGLDRPAGCPVLRLVVPHRLAVLRGEKRSQSSRDREAREGIDERSCGRKTVSKARGQLGRGRDALVTMTGEVAANGEDDVEEAANDARRVSSRCAFEESKGEATHKSHPTPKRTRIAMGGQSQPLENQGKEGRGQKGGSARGGGGGGRMVEERA